MVTTAALYECELRHLRTSPVRHGFNYRTYLWLVDLDDLPRLPLYLRFLAGFRTRDHLGDPDSSLRANVDAHLAAHGIDLSGGSIVMLTNAAVLGHVFNPLTLFWCHRTDGTTACVLAEVHNTYGERHCYLMTPDTRGYTATSKEFYVSPFFPVTGVYRMRLTEPGEKLAVSIWLHQAGGTAFVASLRGARLPLSTAHLWRIALRHPWVTASVSARIRLQGIRLYLRGLPVQPRPDQRRTR